jgi:hypothetical protein
MVNETTPSVMVTVMVIRSFREEWAMALGSE